MVWYRIHKNAEAGWEVSEVFNRVSPCLLAYYYGVFGFETMYKPLYLFFLSIICEAEIHFGKDVPCQAKSSLSKISHSS